MKRIAIAMVLLVGLAGPVQAGELQQIKDKAVHVATAVLVGTDWAMHFTWNTLHNKIVHPAVSFFTLGAVSLEAPADG